MYICTVGTLIYIIEGLQIFIVSHVHALILLNFVNWMATGGVVLFYFVQRDDPKSTDSLLVSNCSKEGCELKIEGESLFSVIRYDNEHQVHVQCVACMII